MPISTLAPRNRPMRGLDENAGDVDSGVIRSKGYGWLGVGVVIAFFTLAAMALIAAFGLK